MRTTTAAELLVLANPNRAVAYRVKVANGSSTMIDVSTYVMSIATDSDIDHPVSSLTVEFRRDDGSVKSLAPLRTDSTLNVLDDGVTFSPQLDLGRTITLEAATTTIGASIVSGDWKLLFSGTIDLLNFEKSPIVATSRDQGATLVDRWLESVANYGTAPGRATESVGQDILDAVYGASVILLNCPVSPAYLIVTYQQQKMSVMDALQQLAQLIGWDVRYRHNEAAGTFKLTLQDPNRAKTTPDYTFDPRNYFDITRLDLDRANIRNAIQVSYFSALLKSRTTALQTDGTSITKYGRRFFEIQEADTSPIDTAAEATNLASYALSDLKEPKATQEIELPFFWPADLGDLYRFSANGVHYNTDQDWAVTSVRHELSPGKHRTIVRVRGQPAGQYLTWLIRGPAQGIYGRVTPHNGVPYPPVPAITHNNTETTDTGWDLAFAGSYGQGGGGANTNFTIKSKIGFAAETTLYSGDATGLPVSHVIPRDAQSDTVVTYTLTDVATAVSIEKRITVPSQRESSIATDNFVFNYNSGGTANGKMWIAFTWSGFNLFRGDGGSTSVPASASLATPPSPTLSQVAGGALGARTLYVRIGYIKNNLMMRVGAEASLAVLAGNVLKVTAPPTIANYDKWVALVGSASNAEFIQATSLWGADYNEALVGFNSATTTSYDNTYMPSGVTAYALQSSSTYYFYPWYEIAAGFVAFDTGSLSKNSVGAQTAALPGHLAVTFGGASALTPAAAGTTSGVSGSGWRL